MPYGMPDYKQGGQSFSLIRVGFVMTLLVGIYIFAFREWINDQYLATITNQTVCFNIGGKWDIWRKQCEVINLNETVFEFNCKDSGGEYLGCLSACRNQVNSTYRVCDAPCNMVCQY